MTWQLSAAATTVLVRQRVRKDELVPLAFKELVLRRAATLEARKRRWLPVQHRLTPTTDPVELPRELEHLAQALRDHVPHGDQVTVAVRKVMNKAKATERVVDDAVDAVVRAGLVTSTPRRFRSPAINRTPAGEEAAARFSTLMDPGEPAVLLLGSRALPEIDRAWRDLEVDLGSLSSFNSIDGARHSADGGGHGGDGGGGHH